MKDTSILQSLEDLEDVFIASVHVILSDVRPHELFATETGLELMLKVFLEGTP